MVRDDANRQSLIEVIDRLRALRFPKVQHRVELWEADVDMAEEDAYLAGLAEKVASGHAIDLAGIVINRSIDSRLDQARLYADDERAVVELRTYRTAMLELANTLSAMTGIPLVNQE